MLNNSESSGPNSYYHSCPPLNMPPPPQYQSTNSTLQTLHSTLTPVQLQDHLIPTHHSLTTADLSTPYQYQFIQHQHHQPQQQPTHLIHHTSSPNLLNTVINDSTSSLCDHLKMNGLIQTHSNGSSSLIEPLNQNTLNSYPLIKQQSHTPVQFVQTIVTANSRPSPGPLNVGLQFDTQQQQQISIKDSNSSSSPSLSPSPPSYSNSNKRTRFQMIATSDDDIGDTKSTTTLPLKIF